MEDGPAPISGPTENYIEAGRTLYHAILHFGTLFLGLHLHASFDQH